jgi:DNA-binding HxlR family transcriptional regulator
MPLLLAIHKASQAGYAGSMTVLEGALADRDSWSAIGRCPVERAMKAVGTRNAMLIMREAHYGTTRFDDFAERVGITEAAASARLRDLVDAGLLAKQPYQEPGSRTRHEYVLTPAGTDLLPVVIGLFEWGQTHTGRKKPSAMQPVHHGCGADAHVAIRCTKGHEVPSDELGLRLRSRPAGLTPA